MSQKENNKQQEQERIKEWLDAVTDIIAFNAIGAAIHVNNGKLPEIIFQEITDEETILDVKGLANIQNWADVPDKIAIQYNPQLLAEAGIKAPEYLQQAMDEALQQPHSVISKNHYVSYVTEPDDNNSLSFYEEIFDEQSQPAGYFKHTFRTEAQKNKYVQSHNINYQQTPGQPIIVNNIQHKQQYLAGPKNSNYGMQLPQPFNSNLPVQNKGAMTNPDDLSQPQPGQILIDKTYPPEDIRSVIQKVGKENFFSKTNFDDIDVEYNWSSDGKKADMYKSCTQFLNIKNAHPNQGCFPIIQGILKAVLDVSQLEKVKYSATQKRIVLPKSAWKAKQIEVYSLPNNPYQDYIYKVLFNIINSTDPATKPRNQQELIFFAIQKIKADYQVARYSNGQQNNIDEDLLEYWGKTGQYIQGDSSSGMKWKNPVVLNLEPLIRQPNKETIQSYIHNGGKISMQVKNGFLSIETILKHIYSKPLNKEDHWYSPVKDATWNDLLNERGNKLFHSWYQGIITDNMLKVYKNAATLAALDGNTFPSTDKNQNDYYFLHAGLFTLFKLNNKKILDYVEPDPNTPQYAFSDNKGSNPFQIDKIVINTQGRGCRRLNNTTTAIANDDEIIQRLFMFAWAGIPLEKNVDFDDDCDPQLKKFYQKMEQGTSLLFKKDPDYYDVSSIRQEIIKRAVRWGLQNNQDPKDVIQDLANNLERLLYAGVPSQQQMKPWSELHAVILNYVSKAFEQQRKRCLGSIKNSKPVICLQKNGQTHTYDIYFQYNNGQQYKASYSMPFFPRSAGQDAIVVQLYINDRLQEQLVPIDGQWHSLTLTPTVAIPQVNPGQVNQGQFNNNGNQQFGQGQGGNNMANGNNNMGTNNPPFAIIQATYDEKKNKNIINLDSLNINLYKLPNNTYTVTFNNGKYSYLQGEPQLNFHRTDTDKGELWITTLHANNRMSNICKIAEITNIKIRNNRIDVEYQNKETKYDKMSFDLNYKLPNGNIADSYRIPLEDIAPPQNITTMNNQVSVPTITNNPANNGGGQPIEVNLNGLLIPNQPNDNDKIKMNMYQHDENGNVCGNMMPVETNKLYYTIDKTKNKNPIMLFRIAAGNNQHKDKSFVYHIGITINNQKLPQPGKEQNVKFTFLYHGQCITLDLPCEYGKVYEFPPKFIQLCRIACKKPAVVNNNIKPECLVVNSNTTGNQQFGQGQFNNNVAINTTGTGTGTTTCINSANNIATNPANNAANNNNGQPKMMEIVLKNFNKIAQTFILTIPAETKLERLLPMIETNIRQKWNINNMKSITMLYNGKDIRGLPDQSRALQEVFGDQQRVNILVSSLQQGINNMGINTTNPQNLNNTGLNNMTTTNMTNNMTTGNPPGGLNQVINANNGQVNNTNQGGNGNPQNINNMANINQPNLNNMTTTVLNNQINKIPAANQGKEEIVIIIQYWNKNNKPWIEGFGVPKSLTVSGLYERLTQKGFSPEEYKFYLLTSNGKRKYLHDVDQNSAIANIGITNGSNIYIVKREKFKGQPTQILKNSGNMNYINNNTTGNNTNLQNLNDSLYYGPPIPEIVPTSKIVNEQPIEVDLTGLLTPNQPNDDGAITMNMIPHDKNGNLFGMLKPVKTNNLCYAIRESKDKNPIMQFWIADGHYLNKDGDFYGMRIDIDNKKLPTPCKNKKVKITFVCNEKRQPFDLTYEGSGWHQFPKEFITFCHKACQKKAVVNNNGSNFPPTGYETADTATDQFSQGQGTTTGTNNINNSGLQSSLNNIQQQPDVIVDLNNFTLTKSQDTFMCKNNTTGGQIGAQGLHLVCKESSDIILMDEYQGNMPIDTKYITWKNKNNVKKMQIKFNGQLFMVNIQDGKCEIPQEVIDTWKSLCQQQQPVNNSNNINNDIIGDGNGINLKGTNDQFVQGGNIK